MNVRVASTIAFAAAVLAACNAITGLGDDFTLVQPEAGADGQPPGNGDGAPPGDAAVSDAPMPDANASFTCDAANVAFCTDFESDAGWDNVELVAGSVTIEADAGLDGSHAMHAHVDDAGVSRGASLWKQLAGITAKEWVHWVIDFDFTIASKTITYSAIGVLALPQETTGLPYYGLASYEPTDNLLDVVDESAVITSDDMGVVPTFGRWSHARLTLDRKTSGTYDATLVVDGQTVDGPRDFDFGDASGAELRIGLLFTSRDPGTMDVYVDDVRVLRSK